MNDKEIIKKAQELLDKATTFWLENYKRAEQDVSFIAGKQWDSEALRRRAEEGRPALTLNKLGQYIRRITGEQKQINNAVQVRPTAGNISSIRIQNHAGTKDYSLAEVYEGLIRNIEENSNATFHYKRAFTQAVSGGIGWLRVLTEYTTETAFDLDVKIKSVRNPWSIFVDPNAQEPDFSDMKWAIVLSKINKDDFEELYPHARTEGMNKSIGGVNIFFGDDKSIGIAEFFLRKPMTKTLVLMSNGETYWQDKVEPILDELAEAGIKIVKSRKAKTYKVLWYKLTAYEVLEKSEWVGSTIPIVPVFGEIIDLKDKMLIKSLIADAKDSQKMHNYWMSAATEKVALAPKSPFVAPVKAIEGFENIWKTANIRNWSVLPYKGDVAPRREAPAPMPAAELQIALSMINEIKSSIGLYDASLGAPSNETSGRAILARQHEGDLNAYVFFDNLNMAIRRIGRILVGIIPKVYDTNRIIRITFPDGTGDFIEINKTVYDDETGKEVVVHDLGQQKFDIVVNAGASYQTKRMETAARLIDFVKAIPQAAQVAPDLIALNMDFAGADELAERLRKTLPPQLLTPEEREELAKSNPAPQPTEQEIAQQQLAKAQIEAQLAQAEAQKLQALAEIEQTKLQGADIQQKVKELVAQALTDIMAGNTGSNENTTEGSEGNIANNQ